MNRPMVMAGIFFGGCVILAGAGMPAARGADSPAKAAAPPAAEDAARQARIAERDRVDVQVRANLSAGNWKEAIAKALEMLAIELEVFGPDHAETDGSRGILAETYAFSGDFDTARRYANESLALQKRLHGEEDWRTREAQDRLALVVRLAELDAVARDEVSQAVARHQQAKELYRERKNQKALDIEQQAVDAQQKHLGDSLATTADCLYFLGQIRWTLEKYDEAVTALESASAIYEKVLGESSPQRANCLAALGLVRRDQQKLDDSITALRAAYAMREKVSGADDVDTRFCQSSLAVVLDRNALVLEEKDEIEAAHKQRQESLDLKRKLYPQADWRLTDGQLLLARNELLATLSAEQRQRLVEARKQQLEASALYRQSKPQEAQKLCQQAYDTRREILGAEHQDIAVSANLLGLIANDAQDFDRAEALLNESAAIWRKLGGPEYPEVATPLQNLADSYEGRSKFVEAKKLTEEAWRIRSKTYGDQDEDTRRSLTTLFRIVGKMATALESADNWSTAEETRLEMVELAGKLFGEKDWRTTDARLLLDGNRQYAKLTAAQRQELSLATQQLNNASQLNEQSKGADAQALAEKALATRKALLGNDSPGVIYARQVFISSLRGQGKYADAELAAKEYAESAARVYGGDHPRYSVALETWGHVLYNQEKYGAANELYRKAYAVRQIAQGEQDSETIQSGIFLANSLTNQALALEAQGDFAAAKSTREQALEVQLAVRGPDAYQVIDARYALEFTQQLAGFDIEQRANLQLADRKIGEANRLNGERKFNAAVEASEDAVRLRKEVLGDKHRLVAIAVFRLGVHVNNRGDAAEAMKILQANDALLKSTLGAINPDYAYTLVYIAGMHQAQNDLARAVPLLRGALEAYTKSYGATSDDAIKTMDTLVAYLQQIASAQLAKSDAAQAKKAWEEIVTLTGQRYGEKSPQAIDAKWGLYRAELWPSLKASQRKELLDSDKWMAIAEQKMKEVRAAEQDYLKPNLARAVVEPARYAAQLRQQVLGDNPATADALDLLGEAQTIAQDGAAALANYQKAFTIRRKTQGESHPAVAKTRQAVVQSVALAAPRPFKPPSSLTAAQQKRLVERDRLEAAANAQYENRQFDGAYRALEQALRIEQEVYGPAHEDIADTYTKLIQVANYANAGQLYRSNWVKLGEVRKKLYGADSWQAVEAQVTVANIDLPKKFNDQQARLFNAAWNYVTNITASNKVAFDAGPDHLQPALEATEEVRKAFLSLVGENHLYYANCLESQAKVYQRQGNQEEADALLRKSAEIVGRILTTKHPMYATRMNSLAGGFARQARTCEEKGEFDKAYEFWRKRVDLLTTLHGADKWQVINARLDAVDSQKVSKLAPELREKVLTTFRSTGGDRPPQVANAPEPEFPDTLQGRYQFFQFLEKQLGDDSLKTIDALFKVASLVQNEGYTSQAVEFAQQSLDLRRRIQGADHPATARNANFVGLLRYLQADYARAEPLLRESQQIMQKLGYNDALVYATYLNNLAMVYQGTGDFDRAEPLLRSAVNVKGLDSFSDEESFETRVDDNEVLMGQFNVAVVTSRNVQGQQPGGGAAPLPPLPPLGPPAPPAPLHLGEYINNLALLAMVRDDFPQAESLLRQALALLLIKHGQGSVQYLNALTNLAMVCQQRGDMEQAEMLAEYVVQDYRRRKGQQAKYALALNFLGVIYQQRGDAVRSEELRREALGIQRNVIGEGHPMTLLTRAELAILSERLGKSADAAAELDSVLDTAATNFQLAAAVQSERQQLRMNAEFRFYLDQYLAVADRAKLPGEKVYRQVLGWKGVVSTRQRQMRALRQAAQKGTDPAIVALYQELAQVNRALASLSFGGESSSEEEAKGAAYGKLTLRKDELERDLAGKSELFGRQHKIQRLTPTDIKAMLPPKTALVDLVEYEHTTYPSDSKQRPVKERRIAAFIVRPGADIARVELGPAAPVEKLVDACREAWLNGRTAETDPAVELRTVLWQPIAEHLGNATTVLVSPDGAASRVPFAALPGNKPDTYLIEDLTIAILPVPQLLGELVASSTPATSAANEGGLLLMGDIDFDAEPGRTSARAPAAARDGTMSKFGPLPGTLAEVQAVGKLFSTSHKQAAKVLEKAAATEEAFRQQAAGAAYLHLATHGFFAPPSVKRGDVSHTDFLAAESDTSQACEGWNPGLLSGIVLAGVNRPIDGSRDDGIVTAAEVSDLNLSQAQLVVLSACETGLGQIAGGEGALGLQRAFQVAGARSVISSLWKVDDAATQMLMTLFYENLWSKKMPPLAAFRQAQLSLLQGKVDTGKLRGLDVAGAAPKPEKENGRLSPRLWAAFVVSGGLQ